MQGNLVKSDTVVSAGVDIGAAAAGVIAAEVAEKWEPVHVTGVLQFMLPSPDESIRMIHSSIANIQSTLTLHTDHLEAISHRVMNDIESIDSLEVLKDIRHKLDVHILEQTVEWTTLSILADKKDLTKDAIRKQLQNGDFEEGVDFKSDGNKIIVHQGAIGRLQRKRRSSNG